jgi:hypothetical protein
MKLLTPILKLYVVPRTLSMRSTEFDFVRENG